MNHTDFEKNQFAKNHTSDEPHRFAKNHTDDEPQKFAKNLISAFVKTVIMGVGEINADLDFTDKDEYESNFNVKFEQFLGKIILLAFVFLFAIVLMNLLNAVAIGDIQVKMMPIKR